MREQVKTTLILVLGWSFIILGIIGLFLPILQGILFILLGLYFLAKRSKKARKLVQKLSLRYPSLAARLKEAELKGESIISKYKDFFRKGYK